MPLFTGKYGLGSAADTSENLRIPYIPARVKLDLLNVQYGIIRAAMEVEFDDGQLDRLETDPGYTAGHSESLISAYRMRLQIIRAATSPNDLLAMKCLAFQRLNGNRSHQYVLRLNDEAFLVVEERVRAQLKMYGVIGIERYPK